jgi:hypothetical protein
MRGVVLRGSSAERVGITAIQQSTPLQSSGSQQPGEDYRDREPDHGGRLRITVAADLITVAADRLTVTADRVTVTADRVTVPQTG